jgi:hypothetical protein
MYRRFPLALVFLAALASPSRHARTEERSPDNSQQRIAHRETRKRPSVRVPRIIHVRHTATRDDGWAVAETPNFRLFHGESRSWAAKVGRLLESRRRATLLKWFNETAEDWSPKCDVFLHPTKTSYARKTGGPPDSPGHSTLTLDGGRVLVRRIDVRADLPHVLEAILPHETAHVVLLGQFGRHFTPRWADEGIAVLSEPRARIKLHLQNLPKHRADGTLFRVKQLLSMEQYPETRRVGSFYAQSVSLVEFLSRKKGASTFIRFLRMGLDKGYEEALRRHYGYRSLAELDREWRRYAFENSVVAGTAKR